MSPIHAIHCFLREAIKQAQHASLLYDVLSFSCCYAINHLAEKCQKVLKNATHSLPEQKLLNQQHPSEKISTSYGAINPMKSSGRATRDYHRERLMHHFCV